MIKPLINGNYFIPNTSSLLYYYRTYRIRKNYFLTNLNLKIIYEIDKIYIYSQPVHQDLHQKRTKGFSNYIPMEIIPNILFGKVTDLVIDEIVNDEDFEKSVTEKKT